ncbi:uncharacterized protein ATNIH1004_001796 [Aspergillus tanneri]|nr:uncharacterized protein ATNIH1004_001796 [Aspergillus tanneri]KAA8652887.1 hypothetical protein ATNIH1004_001796 [Aspergillus tanneri]
MASVDSISDPSTAVDMNDAQPDHVQPLLTSHMSLEAPLPAYWWGDGDFSGIPKMDHAFADNLFPYPHAMGAASFPGNDSLVISSAILPTESDFFSGAASLRSGSLLGASVPLQDGSQSGSLSMTQQSQRMTDEEVSSLGRTVRVTSSSATPSPSGSGDTCAKTRAVCVSRRNGICANTQVSSLTGTSGRHSCITDWTIVLWGGMVEPMANALACVEAYASSAGPNSGFVHRMITLERERLVRKFNTYTNTPETCLDALHAVCIYQTSGLFGDQFLPAVIKKTRFPPDGEGRPQDEFVKAAEGQSSFLLKTTRRLDRLHAKTMHIHHQDKSDWDRWKFIGSLRRNLLFMHIINVLESKTRKLNETYF